MSLKKEQIKSGLIVILIWVLVILGLLFIPRPSFGAQPQFLYLYDNNNVEALQNQVNQLEIKLEIVNNNYQECCGVRRPIKEDKRTIKKVDTHVNIPTGLSAVIIPATYNSVNSLASSNGGGVVRNVSIPVKPSNIIKPEDKKKDCSKCNRDCSKKHHDKSFHKSKHDKPGCIKSNNKHKANKKSDHKSKCSKGDKHGHKAKGNDGMHGHSCMGKRGNGHSGHGKGNGNGHGGRR